MSAAIDTGVPVLTWVGDKLLAPAIIGVMFSLITALILERYRGRRDAVTKLGEALRDDLRSAQQLAVEYWARASKKDDAVVEARMVAIQTDLLASLRLFQTFLGCPLCSGITDLEQELLDALTGGAFQTRPRPADPSRILRVAKVSARLREEVSTARIRNIERAFKWKGPGATRWPHKRS